MVPGLRELQDSVHPQQMRNTDARIASHDNSGFYTVSRHYYINQIEAISLTDPHCVEHCGGNVDQSGQSLL